MDKNHNIPTDLIMKDLKDVISVFKKFEVQAFLSYGAVLGAVRDGDFIPWDDDIDLDVIASISLQTRKQIGNTLGDLGFKAQSIGFNVLGRMEMSTMGDNGECRYDGDGETGIIVCERNFKFSIFFYREDGEDYVITPKPLGVPLLNVPRKFYDKFYDKPDKVKLHGETFITPSPLKEYLTWVYGDWKTPLKDKHAPQFRERLRESQTR